MSPRANGRHRSDSSPSTPLTALGELVTDGLQRATATGGRGGAVLAVTTGLVATMGVPAANAALRGSAERSSSTTVALSQTVSADVVTRPVSAPPSAAVRFERPAFVVAPKGRHRAPDADSADAVSDVARVSRALARAAYKDRQAAALPARRPKHAAPGVSGGSCSISSSIESHLASNARAVYRAVCAAFGDSVSSFGGYRAGDGGDHGSGRAVDIMVSGDPGWAIARFVQAHAKELGVTYVIYQQKIWLAGRPTSQWRAMEDRGSATANHYDHVHVSVS